MPLPLIKNRPAVVRWPCPAARGGVCSGVRPSNLPGGNLRQARRLVIDEYPFQKFHAVFAVQPDFRLFRRSGPIRIQFPDVNRFAFLRIAVHVDYRRDNGRRVIPRDHFMRIVHSQ